MKRRTGTWKLFTVAARLIHKYNLVKRVFRRATLCIPGAKKERVVEEEIIPVNCTRCQINQLRCNLKLIHELLLIECFSYTPKNQQKVLPRPPYLRGQTSELWNGGKRVVSKDAKIPEVALQCDCSKCKSQSTVGAQFVDAASFDTFVAVRIPPRVGFLIQFYLSLGTRTRLHTYV